MVYDGITREKGRANRIKYICPKVKKTKVNGKNAYILNCVQFVKEPITNLKV